MIKHDLYESKAVRTSWFYVQNVKFAGHVVSFRTQIKYFDFCLKMKVSSEMYLNAVYLCKHFRTVLIALLFSFLCQEHLNIMLFELSQRLHNALSKVDVSFYTSLKDGQSESKESAVLLCSHMRPAKLVTVKKEGQNKVLFIPCLFTVPGVCLFVMQTIWCEQLPGNSA